MGMRGRGTLTALGQRVFVHPLISLSGQDQDAWPQEGCDASFAASLCAAVNCSTNVPPTLFMFLISSSCCRMRSAAPFTFSFSSLSSCQASSSSSLSLASCSSLTFSSRLRIFSSACS